MSLQLSKLPRIAAIVYRFRFAIRVPGLDRSRLSKELLAARLWERHSYKGLAKLILVERCWKEWKDTGDAGGDWTLPFERIDKVGNIYRDISVVLERVFKLLAARGSARTCSPSNPTQHESMSKPLGRVRGDFRRRLVKSQDDLNARERVLCDKGDAVGAPDRHEPGPRSECLLDVAEDLALEPYSEGA
ncbi:hypothetical protein BDK51DRAFT_32747 [Blyttiomyces helicus]|uniref:Uncharacterized protein n=1 Tax=Blyttiomyces helicus TaxID=388810 RepID=A0A4P9W0U3_9FUNG|nr:hypothetical protein BDK51DRAFT_32747 [Blyttiomyces helicus]|eukprot:RKO84180.1 hypothetical protein BDK51DRAFT_32747 [Blyttiomyces helicus]